jgi:hypothetical protein
MHSKSVLCSLLLLGGAVAASAQPSPVIANLSTRGFVGSASGSLIAGFVVEGTAAKNVLIRGIGPGLAEFGVTNPAAAVSVNVYDQSGNLVAANHGFQTDPNAALTAETAATVGAFPLTAAGDSAVLASLAPGAYSIEIAPDASDAPDGDALLEVYDADAPGSGSTIANLSSRGQVGASAGTLISGFVIAGDTAKNVIVRGVGPDLAMFGVANPAAAVDITIYDASGNIVATNSGYQNDPNAANVVQDDAALGAFPLNDPGDSELLANLAPGAYTVVVSPTASDAPDGVGLVEVYDADAAVVRNPGS